MIKKCLSKQNTAICNTFQSLYDSAYSLRGVGLCQFQIMQHNKPGAGSTMCPHASLASQAAITHGSSHPMNTAAHVVPGTCILPNDRCMLNHVSNLPTRRVLETSGVLETAHLGHCWLLLRLQAPWGWAAGSKLRNGPGSSPLGHYPKSRDHSPGTVPQV